MIALRMAAIATLLLGPIMAHAAISQIYTYGTAADGWDAYVWAESMEPTELDIRLSRLESGPGLVRMESLSGYATYQELSPYRIRFTAEAIQFVRLANGTIKPIGGLATYEIYDRGTSSTPDRIDFDFSPTTPDPSAVESASIDFDENDIELRSNPRVEIVGAKLLRDGVEIYAKATGVTKIHPVIIDIVSPIRKPQSIAFRPGVIKTIVVPFQGRSMPRFNSSGDLYITADFTLPSRRPAADGVFHFESPIVLIPGIISRSWPDLAWGLHFEADRRGVARKLWYENSSLTQYVYTKPSVENPPSDGHITTYNFHYEQSFHSSALQLRGKILSLMDQSYFDKVRIVAHSRGGLVSRALLQRNPYTETTLSDVNGKSMVEMAVLAQVPNLGSPYMRFLPESNHPYPSLMPIYSWYRKRIYTGSAFTWTSQTTNYLPDGLDKGNRELSRLNGLDFVTNVNYGAIAENVPITFLWSRSHGTTSLITYDYYHGLYTGYFRERRSRGDGVVPAFSQLATMLNPNWMPWGWSDDILQANPVEVLSQPNVVWAPPISGRHEGYMDLPAVRSKLYDLLFEEFP